MKNIEELKTKKRNLKKVMFAMIFLVLIMIGAGIYLTIKKGINPFIFLSILFLSIVLIIYTNIQKIKKEIEEYEN